jgi:DNA-binding transcriptional LysR family regulator
MHTVPWAHVEAFLSVMRHGSLSGAGRALGLAHPTIRRRVEALEDQLGTPLFARGPNGLLPTAAAHRILPLAQTMASTLGSLVREASAEGDAQGTVRIAVSELMGREVLPDVLASLQEAHPDVQIELLVSNDLADLTRRDADIAVRMAPLSGEALVARRVGAVQLGFFASPAYLARHPAPETLADLRAHRLLGYDANPAILDGLAALGLPLRARDFAFRTDDDGAYLAALRAGLGIGITHVPLGAGLVRVLPVVSLPVDVWLVVHRDLRDVPRIRTTLEHLQRGLARYLC